MKIIAVDFDGCLCQCAWPLIGKANDDVIQTLIQRRAQGDKLILWTCREGKLLENAVGWCLTRGLAFDAVNENLPERTAQYGNDCRKISADEYWDDHAVRVRYGEVAQAEESAVVNINIMLPPKDELIDIRYGWKPNE